MKILSSIILRLSECSLPVNTEAERLCTLRNPAFFSCSLTAYGKCIVVSISNVCCPQVELVSAYVKSHMGAKYRIGVRAAHVCLVPPYTTLSAYIGTNDNLCFLL